MRLDAFIVADSVRAGAGGKLEIGGAFVTTVNSEAEPPITVAALGFVARFLLDAGDADTTHEVVLRLESDEGEVFSSPTRVIPHERLTSQADAGNEAAVIVSLEVHGLSFPGYGEYRLELVLNGQTVGERFIQVVKMPNESEPGDKAEVPSG